MVGMLFARQVCRKTPWEYMRSMLTDFRLFVVALGRPGMIAQRDMSVAKPTLLPEMEYDSWTSDGPVARISIPASHSILNMNSTCEMFEMASAALEEM